MLTITERAARLIDADGLKRLAEPISELGRDARTRHKPFDSSEQDAWAADRAECLALQIALAADQDIGAKLGAALRRAERLGDASTRTIDGGADVADLFRVKALLHVAHTVATLFIDAGINRPCARLPITLADLGAALRALDGGATIRARFMLEDRFDSTMAEARAEHDLARAAFDDARAVLVDALESDHGGTLRREELYVAAPSVEAQEALDADPRLRLLRTEGGSRTYGLVASPEVERLRVAWQSADARVRCEERRVLDALCAGISDWSPRLGAVEEWLGRIDFLFARVRLAERFPSWPEPAARSAIERGWVPRVRAQVERDNGQYQPQSLAAERGVTLLSGPNMGGKTVALTLVGTVQLLAQLGYPAPAESCAFSWVDRIDYVGADLSNTAAGLSSFAGEMAALAEALEAGGPALLLVDELGRSTNPREGAALADAAISELSRRDLTAVVVTHFPEVGRQADVRALRVAGIATADPDALREDARQRGWQAALNSAMDFALVEDNERATASDALRIAELLGVPESVLRRAAAALEPKED